MFIKKKKQQESLPAASKSKETMKRTTNLCITITKFSTQILIIPKLLTNNPHHKTFSSIPFSGLLNLPDSIRIVF